MVVNYHTLLTGYPAAIYRQHSVQDIDHMVDLGVADGQRRHEAQ